MLDHLKANNRGWAARKIAADAGFFERLARQQAPEYLWIGCADSRVPAIENFDARPRRIVSAFAMPANPTPPPDANDPQLTRFIRPAAALANFGVGCR